MIPQQCVSESKCSQEGHLYYFFFPRNINFHMVLKIVSVGWIQTIPFRTSAPLAGASEGLLWSGFQMVLGHFPECMDNPRICHTKAVTVYPAQHAAPHWSREQGIKGQPTFLTTHLIVQSYTRETLSLTQTGNQLMPKSMRKGSLITQWAGSYKDHFGMKNNAKCLELMCFYVPSIKSEHEGFIPFLILRRKSEPLIRNIVGRL